MEKVVDGEAALEVFDEVARVGQGSLEVRVPELEFPVLTVSVRGGFAVVHCFEAPDRVALLYGDGAVAAGDTVEVPIADELAVFSGEFVLKVADARDALAEFVRSGDPAGLGEWWEL
ncbi:hypothetical protein ACI2LF_08070 [Kribbella sp. NPDC020789]